MNMNQKTLLLIGMAAATFMANAATQASTTASIQEVSFTQVHLNDGFWTPRIEINRTVSIPSAFHECEVNGRFDNFALAAGLIQGEHKGDFSFDDTDHTRLSRVPHIHSPSITMPNSTIILTRSSTSLHRLRSLMAI